MVYLQTCRFLIFSSIFFNSPVFLYGNDTVVDTKKVQQDNWFAIDKAQHFSYSCFIALGIQYVLVNKLDFEEKSAMPTSLGLSFVAGIAKEFQDSKGKSGYFSQKDLFANALGLILAAMVILSHPV
tara:strand:- start:271 stop:648 length:378 start_codon:yes stop_codon:yes gene_type:complete